MPTTTDRSDKKRPGTPVGTLITPSKDRGVKKTKAEKGKMGDDRDEKEKMDDDRGSCDSAAKREESFVAKQLAKLDMLDAIGQDMREIKDGMTAINLFYEEIKEDNKKIREEVTEIKGGLLDERVRAAARLERTEQAQKRQSIRLSGCPRAKCHPWKQRKVPVK